MSDQAASTFDRALADIRATARAHHLATMFGWQDIAHRYRRSRVGAFWVTLNMSVTIGALGLIFGTLFRVPITQFLPYICISLIFWTFISSCINEGCTSFTDSEGMILQVRIPLFVHVLRTIYRNGIVLAHNLLILPLVLLAVGRLPDWHAVFAIPGVLLMAINALWMMLILSVVCVRYRDLTHIVQNFLQVTFYLTPLMWMPQTLPEGPYRFILDFNPLYHLMMLVRAPLFGDFPTSANWMVSILLAVAGWTIALHVYGRYRHRIPYWL
ncbi:MAG TPA: ABC transporter permease [Hyphomicrobiaceae bacterium]|nr:ABC transporter permease [Hyphomicrobiaceae bacterium]